MARARAVPSETAQERFLATFSAAVQHARRVRGHTQVALAALVGIAPNTLARIERGELCPSVFIAQRLAAALAVPLESLTSPPRVAPPLSRTKLADTKLARAKQAKL